MPGPTENTTRKLLYLLTSLLILAITALGYAGYRWRQTDDQLKQTTAQLHYTQHQLSQANYGDLNHDGSVTVKDLSILSRHYGKKDAQ